MKKEIRIYFKLEIINSYSDKIIEKYIKENIVTKSISSTDNFYNIWNILVKGIWKEAICIKRSTINPVKLFVSYLIVQEPCKLSDPVVINFLQSLSLTYPFGNIFVHASIQTTLILTFPITSFYRQRNRLRKINSTLKSSLKRQLVAIAEHIWQDWRGYLTYMQIQHLTSQVMCGSEGLGYHFQDWESKYVFRHYEQVFRFPTGAL